MGLANNHTWLEVVNNTIYKIEVTSSIRGEGWDKNANPAKNFNGKEIFAKICHTEEEKIESNKEKDSFFTMTVEIFDGANNGKNTIIKFPETNQRYALEIDNKEKATIYSSDSYNIIRWIGKKAEIDKKGKKTEEKACKFIIEKGKSKDESLRFAVIADTHFENIHTNGNLESEINDFVESIDELKPQFLVMCGDLTHYNKGGVGDHSQEHCLNDFINKVEKRGIPVYEGFGNHDLMDIPTRANIVKYIKGRNEERAKKGRHEFEYSNRETDYYYDNERKKVKFPYHYTWKRYINGVGIRFFMLNNVPGYGEILSKFWVNVTDEERKKDIKKEAKYERDPKGSLNYFERILNEKKEDLKGDVFVNTFFHINFEAAENERWWTKKSQDDYVKVVKENGYKMLPSFFGHIHNGIIEEKLDTLTGYRNGCGLNMMAIVDITKNNNELVYNVQTVKYGKDIKACKTLRFDIKTGAQTK